MAMGAGFFFLGVFALQLLDFDRVSGRQEATPLAKFAEPSGKPEGEIKAELALPADFSGATAWGEVLGMVPVARKARAAKGNEAP